MDRRRNRAVPSLIGLALLLSAGRGFPAIGAQAPVDDAAVRQQGRGLYMEHCAGCHGASGRGDGPAAASLRRPPTDLTGYSQANAGVFPDQRLRSVIDGRGVGAHGSVEMPVWGSVFKATGGSEAAARQRIDAIVAYLRAIQASRGHLER